MRIAIDISQVVYEGTGVAKYTAELVKKLLEIDKVNRYLLFGMSLRRQKALKDFAESVLPLNSRTMVKILPLPQKAGQILWNKLHLVDIEQFTGRIDIFHSSDWLQPPARAKKVTTVHDLVVYKYPQTSHPDIIRAHKERLRGVKKECDLVFADSLATKDDLVNLLKFNPAKIEVVYAGLGEEFKKTRCEEIDRVRKKYELFDDYILAVGTLEPRKNLSRVIKAFEKVSRNPLVVSRRKPLELVTVGKTGWQEKLPQTRHIRSLGYIDQKDLPALYCGACLFVYPSLYEGFGLPVLEAMACGVPVVTSDRGSLKEIAADAALAVDPEEVEDIALKMTRIFMDEKLKSELIKKGLENAAKFTWKKTAEKVLSFYKKLVRNSSS
ncbi:glycosyltransferase family 4 protein [Candidatus Microgenomates bacterium]|nr:glycosyltransferase family 4 protein [Candidatus Microgenomates bacterium]